VPERRWHPLPEYELAEVTELRYQPTGWSHPYRYVIKREVAETKAGELYWKYSERIDIRGKKSMHYVLAWRDSS
jgi:hypothetical protein